MAYKLGIVGYPLGHSISAVIQHAGLQSLGLEGQYDVLETQAEDLISRIKYLKYNNYDGFNVTIPLKIPMSLFMDEIDDNANIIGCVNVVKIDPKTKQFYGYNTDISGFQGAIPKNINLKGANVSILGTGGAARAAAAGCAKLGVSEIDFYTRNIINSSETIKYMRHMFPQVTFNVYQTQSMRDLPHTQMLINATPVGMQGHSANEMPISLQTLMTLDANALVYDIIYNPTKTKLLEEAQKRGYKTINGLDMLIQQGAKALEIWTGKMPDVKDMKIAALEAL